MSKVRDRHDIRGELQLLRSVGHPLATMQLVTALAALSALVAAVSAVAEGPLATECTCREYVLVCVNGNWTSLPPLVPCPDATIIQLQGNLLQDIPDGLTAFVTVSAPHNRLTRLPEASKLNPEIKNLVLNDNQISGSANNFRSLSSLSRLRLERNRLTSLDFLPERCNLRNLDVSGNALTSLAGPLKNCAELTFLGLESNLITSIPSDVFSRMSKLKHLYLFKNKIAAIPDGTFAHLSALIDLTLQMNPNIQLSSGSFQGLSHLQYLDLSFNELRNLPAGLFTPLPQLRKLVLSKNKLTTLPANTFSSLNALKELTMWANQLTQLPVLQNCCGSLEEYNLLNNNIVAPSEEAVRSVLKGKIVTKIGGALVHPDTLRWAAEAQDVEKFVGSSCSCGGLRRGTAKIEFCVDTPCGAGKRYPDWRAVIAA
ncbi:hypothetical protein R5R35_008778 [Gryllus longicercus]|uniref:Uncharacterized protein n=1 Tax=Gryllus longicercus TaxID=2509291 RepID=A0AAN9W0J4_9ORTH